MLASIAPANEIILQPGDHISVDLVLSPELSREVVVDATGSIRLPYAGTLGVDGMSLDAARDLVAAKLEASVGIDPASVLMDVIERVPVYVLANGSGSGPIPYRPGMTVLMAAASATPRQSERLSISLIEEFEAARKPFDVRQTRERLAVTQIRIARLQAEFNEVEFIPPNAEQLNVSQDRWGLLVDREADALEAQRTLLSDQDAILAEQEVQQADLIVQLREQSDVLEQRRAIVEKERDRLTDLTTQGLVSQTRLENIQGEVLDVEFARIEVLTELRQAQTDLAVVRRARGSLQGNRNVVIAETLADLNSEAEQLSQQILSLQSQIALTGGAIRLNLDRDAEDTIASTLQIFRGGVTLEAAPEDPLQPGDVVLIDMSAP